MCFKRKSLLGLKAGRPFNIEFEEHATTQGGEDYLVFRVGGVPELPKEWSLIVGDSLFDFRASLDYVAWQLVRCGTDPNPKVPENVGWPIYHTESGFLKNIGRKLPGLLPKHRTVVEASQPYHAKTGKLHPLGVLNDLSRQDKHRQIVVVFAAHKEYKVGGSIRHFTMERTVLPSSGVPVPLKQGTELIRIYGRRMNNHEPEVDVAFEGTTGVAFENGVWVLDALPRIEKRIGNILMNFEPLL
jgi:hypothetical protein